MRYTQSRIYKLLGVSIHAPAKGAITGWGTHRSTSSFNSRTREGCDVKDPRRLSRMMFQFTHPRRVRWLDSNHDITLSGFNSRTREGCDIFSDIEALEGFVSIHAPAKGAISVCFVKPRKARFNSRTREGCDGRRSYHGQHKRFQFTHPRRVRLP